MLSHNSIISQIHGYQAVRHCCPAAQRTCTGLRRSNTCSTQLSSPAWRALQPQARRATAAASTSVPHCSRASSTGTPVALISRGALAALPSLPPAAAAATALLDCRLRQAPRCASSRWLFTALAQAAESAAAPVSCRLGSGALELGLGALAAMPVRRNSGYVIRDVTIEPTKALY